MFVGVGVLFLRPIARPRTIRRPSRPSTVPPPSPTCPRCVSDVPTHQAPPRPEIKPNTKRPCATHARGFLRGENVGRTAHPLLAVAMLFGDARAGVTRGRCRLLPRGTEYGRGLDTRERDPRVVRRHPPAPPPPKRHARAADRLPAPHAATPPNALTPQSDSPPPAPWGESFMAGQTPKDQDGSSRSCGGAQSTGGQGVVNLPTPRQNTTHAVSAAASAVLLRPLDSEVER